MPDLSACVFGAGSAAMQAQLLPRLYQRSLGQGSGHGPMSGMQQRLQPETSSGEKPQAVEHRGKVQRIEHRESSNCAALHPVSPRATNACSESVSEMQGAMLPVPRTDAPAAALVQRGTPASGSSRGSGMELPAAPRVPTVPLRGRARCRVPLLLRGQMRATSRTRRLRCRAATQ